jgi:hypothetical protein
VLVVKRSTAMITIMTTAAPIPAPKPPGMCVLLEVPDLADIQALSGIAPKRKINTTVITERSYATEVRDAAEPSLQDG